MWVVTDPRISRIPDLEALRLLVAIARQGSIGAAAREIGVSQQAASERLRAMETTVGLTLVRRTARGSDPTEAGAVLVEWATRLLDLAEETEAAIDGLRDDRSRELSVWASMTIVESLIPRWLVRLRRQQTSTGSAPPTVNLTASNSRAVLEAVRTGAADVGFVEGRDAPRGLRHRAVASDELVLVTAPGTPVARRRRPLTPLEVAELSMTRRERGSGTREVVEAALADHGLIGGDSAVELTTATTIRAAVLAQGAPAFLSRRLVGPDLATGQLVEVPTDDLDLTRVFRAVWVGARHPPAGPVRDLIAIAASLDGSPASP